MKLVLIEPGTQHVEEMWAAAGDTASSVVAYTEVAGAVAAAARARRISVRRREMALEDLDSAWQRMYTYGVDHSLAVFAGAVAGRHGLRALDAVHLATALSVARADPVVVSWDRELRRAAEAEGLAVSPA